MVEEFKRSWKGALLIAGVLLLFFVGLVVVDAVLLRIDMEDFCKGKMDLQQYPVCERNARYLCHEGNVSVMRTIDCSKY